MSKNPIHQTNFNWGGRGQPILYIFYVLFSGLLVSSAWAQEAKDLNKIQALRVGDQIPEALWNIPLKVVNHPEGKGYIRLRDYRDRELIILDFWSSWCSGCINKMPESVHIQKEFSDKIQIVYSSSEGEDKLKRIVENLPSKECLDYVYEDSIFNKVFPHKLVPHVVWVNNCREVIAITAGKELSSANIQDYFKTGKLKIRLKQDILDFDQNRALKDNLDKLNIAPLRDYTSCISSAIPGIGSNSGIEEGVISHINSNILSLYRTALNLRAINKNISINTVSVLFRFQNFCFGIAA
ncbi:TlpA family protein disulfide reductase [Sphingobacterium faecale]|uniref:Redoxin domain-containing protein n=1 Tax=Sphingobacterium faecale TaxID=2803775 RepID=A0ABS1R6U6_9SPHI|nr:redoxin domain-containing protein [Sphingobacterium faecale]MBL1410423.1 redoxin domain-containing protein [Sphingobacterium faecale]